MKKISELSDMELAEQVAFCLKANSSDYINELIKYYVTLNFDDIRLAIYQEASIRFYVTRIKESTFDFQSAFSSVYSVAQKIGRQIFSYDYTVDTVTVQGDYFQVRMSNEFTKTFSFPVSFMTSNDLDGQIKKYVDAYLNVKFKYSIIRNKDWFCIGKFSSPQSVIDCINTVVACWEDFIVKDTTTAERFSCEEFIKKYQA